MDELKKLLRRLDGLESNKSLAKNNQDAGAEHRGYVGALRGSPAPSDEEAASVPSSPSDKKPAFNSSVFVAAAGAALISTVTVYLVMSSQGGLGDRGPGLVPLTERIAPATATQDLRQSGTGAPEEGQQGSTDTPEGQLRRAELLLERGDVEAARTLLKHAAELGSGKAALKLGHSYDPTQTKTVSVAEGQANPELAKAWYERALALGTQEAASYISDPSVR